MRSQCTFIQQETLEIRGRAIARPRQYHQRKSDRIVCGAWLAIDRA
jgi:hypothetical protein